MPHLFKVAQEQFPKLLEYFVNTAKEYAQSKEHSSFIKLIRGEFGRCKGNKSKDLIRVIRIFDCIIKDVSSYRDQVGQVIG